MADRLYLTTTLASLVMTLVLAEFKLPGKFSGANALAQSRPFGTASVTGDLKSPEGESLTEVAVRVTNLNRGIAVTKTGNRGKYEITGLLPGIYEVVTRKEGYEPAVQKKVVLQAGERKVIDLTLKPGDDNELKELLTTISDRAALMPEGEVRNIIIGGCVGGCHDLTEVLSGRKTKEEWNTTIDRMLKLAWRSTRRSATIRQGKEVMADYLARHFGPTAPPLDWSKIKAVPYNPDARFIFTQFSIPNLKGRETHPHDPIVDSQGNVWHTGSYDDTIGKFDPRSATFTRYPVPTPDSVPHGITVDRQDNIWFTLEIKDKIAKLDPKTGIITEYAMPVREARAHTLIFDSRGILWVTAMGKLFRFDTKTEKFETFNVPWKPSRPYGLVFDSKGMVWFSDFHTSDTIGRLDPQTGKFTRYDPPTKQGGRRRIAVDSKDNIWFTQYYAHKIGRIDAKTFAITEYDTPSPAATPYAITVDKNDIVWFTEHGSNRLAKFDPRTGTFTEVLMPSPRALVRKVAWDPQGRLWLAESEIDKITMVEEY